MNELKEETMMPVQNHPGLIIIDRKIKYDSKSIIEDLAVIRSVLVTGIVALHFLKLLRKIRTPKKTLVVNMTLPKEKKEEESKGE